MLVGIGSDREKTYERAQMNSPRAVIITSIVVNLFLCSSILIHLDRWCEVGGGKVINIRQCWRRGIRWISGMKIGRNNLQTLGERCLLLITEQMSDWTVVFLRWHFSHFSFSTQRLSLKERRRKKQSVVFLPFLLLLSFSLSLDVLYSNMQVRLSFLWTCCRRIRKELCAEERRKEKKPRRKANGSKSSNSRLTIISFMFPPSFPFWRCKHAWSYLSNVIASATCHVSLALLLLFSFSSSRCQSLIASISPIFTSIIETDWKWHIAQRLTDGTRQRRRRRRRRRLMEALVEIRLGRKKIAFSSSSPLPSDYCWFWLIFTENAFHAIHSSSFGTHELSKRNARLRRRFICVYKGAHTPHFHYRRMQSLWHPQSCRMESFLPNLLNSSSCSFHQFNCKSILISRLFQSGVQRFEISFNCTIFSTWTIISIDRVYLRFSDEPKSIDD